MVQCDVANELTQNLMPHAPRSILKLQVGRAALQGFTAMAASELEYFIYKTSYKDAFKQGYRDLEAMGWHNGDYSVLQGTREEVFNSKARRHLARSGVPVENSKGETGVSQHELNVRYTDILQMADRHVVLKQCLKEVADVNGMSVTFMAKPEGGQAGNSCHIHFSMERDGVNAFQGDQDLGNGVKCSSTFRHFLGGWMKWVPDFFPFYAPTVNSYKRFVSGSWAPTRLTWSIDNRTASFRVVGHGSSLRIEFRVPGADANPYLAFAAALASGLDGIQNKIEPPPMATGNSYDTGAGDDGPTVPRDLAEAAARFKASEFVAAALGKDVQAHYVRFFENEAQAYAAAVTDWEQKRYFELI